MGQLLSSEEEISQVKKAVGSLLYGAMLEGGAVPDVSVAHPLLLLPPGQEDPADPGARILEQLRQLQGDIGSRAPSYLKDLIGRLASLSDEPRLAGLVGLVVTVVMDLAYTASRRSPAAKGKSPGSSSGQRVFELQEVMEEYLKRWRINLSDRQRLVQDAIRLEAQLSFTLTRLKTCLLAGDCDSRCVRHWASGAAFHTQMLVHLAALEGRDGGLQAARAALEQYQEDLAHLTPAYRRYKSNTVHVVKCRGGLPSAGDPGGEEPGDGAMTGLRVTDRETGGGATLSLAAIREETGRRGLDPDLIPSDQYAQAYLDHLFSEKGPLAELRDYFSRALERLDPKRSEQGGSGKADGTEPGERRRNPTEGGGGGGGGETESLKLSVVETQQPPEDL